tara:strand:- start:197 stop:607 length:411 start_codon:yes stop_codon:yes gene_type:complete
MRWLALIVLLSACTAKEVGNSLLPDEFTYGASSGDHYGNSKLGPFDGKYEGVSESSYAALTWHLPQLESKPTVDRDEILSTSVVLNEEPVEEEFSESLATGATFKADWRHASAFGGVIAILLIGLLVKLQRSNGWH